MQETHRQKHREIKSGKDKIRDIESNIQTKRQTERKRKKDVQYRDLVSNF